MKSGDATSAMKGATGWLRAASVVTLLLAASHMRRRVVAASRRVARMRQAVAGGRGMTTIRIAGRAART